MIKFDKWNKLFAFAALVAAFTWSLIQIGDYLRKPSEKLTAEIDRSSLELPPSWIERLAQVRDPEEFDRMLHEEFRSKGLTNVNISAAWLTEAFTQNVIRELYWNLKAIHGCWSAQVKNDGDKTLNDVLLVLPYTTVALIERRNQTHKMVTNSASIEIGSLQPREWVSLTAWTDRPLSEYDADDVLLTHSSGIGTVTKWIRVKDTLSFRIGKAVVSFAIFLVRFLAVAVVISVLISLVGRLFTNKQSISEETSDSKDPKSVSADEKPHQEAVQAKNDPNNS